MGLSPLVIIIIIIITFVPTCWTCGAARSAGGAYQDFAEQPSHYQHTEASTLLHQRRYGAEICALELCPSPGGYSSNAAGCDGIGTWGLPHAVLAVSAYFKIIIYYSRISTACSVHPTDPTEWSPECYERLVTFGHDDFP